MSWVPSRRSRRWGFIPAYCEVWRTEIIPRLDVLRLVAHDDLHPELDGATTAFGASVLFRRSAGLPHGRNTVDLSAGFFFVPATRRPGGRLAAALALDALVLGPELWVVAPREVRATLDVGLRFEI